MRQRDAASRWLIAVTAAVCVLFIAAGFLAHYYVGTGHSVPYLTP
jgi:hypothetical protein